MAAAPKSLKMTRLQSAIDKVINDRGIKDLVIIITPAVFNLFTSMKWHRMGPDSLASGLFGNPFIWGACDEEATNALNLRARYVHGGETAASDADVQTLLRLVVKPPLEDESIDNLKRMEIVASVLLPEGHGFLTHLRQHIKRFSDYERQWRTLAITNASHQGAKGVYHLQFLALRFSKYWRDQRLSPARVVLDSPEELFTLIELGKAWEPKISSSLALALKLGALGRFGHPGVGQPKAAEDDAMTLATAASSNTGLTIGNFQSLMGTAAASGSTVGGSKGKDNIKFHHALFGEIKGRMVNGKTVKSRDVREKIKKGELPPLPPSKADGNPMCLAWHTKGICNPDCPRAADHDVDYSVEEYQPLVGWCSTNYPKEE